VRSDRPGSSVGNIRIRPLGPAAIVVWALSCPVSAAMAQTVIQGRVSGRGRAIAGAEVAVGVDATTTTDSSGAYQVLLLHGGLVRVTARAIGYYPGSRGIAVAAAGDTVHLDFVLEPTPQQLDSLSVNAPAPVTSPRMAAFAERREAGIGRFYSREFLAKHETSTVANLFQMTTGVRVVPRPSRCGGGYAVGSGRTGQRRYEAWMSCLGAAFPAACYFAIYVDGARFWVPGSTEPPDINQFTIRGFEAVEVYRGPAEVPVQYPSEGSYCGLVVFWLRESR
jgi:6,7-dimethyl-8-ribityllumazine synthase